MRTSGFGMADIDTVRETSSVATKVWPHSTFWHWYVISFIIDDMVRLLAALTRFWQCGHGMLITRMASSPERHKALLPCR